MLNSFFWLLLSFVLVSKRSFEIGLVDSSLRISKTIRLEKSNIAFEASKPVYGSNNISLNALTNF